MHVRRISAAVVLLAALAGVTTTAAIAADAGKITVNYKDLDLSREADAKTMLQRIKDAAERICDLRGTADLLTKSAREACVKDTVNDAVASLNSPLVAALNANQAPVS